MPRIIQMTLMRPWRNIWPIIKSQLYNKTLQGGLGSPSYKSLCFPTPWIVTTMAWKQGCTHFFSKEKEKTKYQLPVFKFEGSRLQLFPSLGKINYVPCMDAKIEHFEYMMKANDLISLSLIFKFAFLVENGTKNLQNGKSRHPIRRFFKIIN